MPKIVTGVGPTNALGHDPDWAPSGGALLPGPPPARAPKAEHAAYAAQVLGVDPDEAAAKTKAQLVGLAQAAAAEGGDGPSAGISSSTSSSTGPRSSTSTPPGHLHPAPSAGSLSSAPPPATPG